MLARTTTKKQSVVLARSEDRFNPGVQELG
jgi:hypothetical protein